MKIDDIIVKRFESPDEVRVFEKGKFEVVHFESMTIGRATYYPGWKWSEDVSPISGSDFCEVEHLVMVVSGVATCAFKDGEVHELRAGDLFYIGPDPHDSWVVGEENYVSLHFHGAEKYAK